MSLMLRVVFPPGLIPGKKHTMVNLDAAQTVQECVEGVCRANKVPDPDDYLIYIPAGANNPKSKWLGNDDVLVKMGVQPKDTIQLRRKHQVSRTTCVVDKRTQQQIDELVEQQREAAASTSSPRSGLGASASTPSLSVSTPSLSDFDVKSTSILFPVTEPLAKVMSYLSEKFQVPNIDEYALYVIGQRKELPQDQSIRDLAIPATVHFLLRHRTRPFDPTVIEQNERREASAKKGAETNENKIPINLQLAAKAIPQPDKAGPIDVQVLDPKTRKGRTKMERRFAVLKKDYLAIYPNPDVNAPLLVLSLAKHTLKVTNEKKKKHFLFELNVDAGTDQEQLLIIRFPTTALLAEWVGKISKGKITVELDEPAEVKSRSRRSTHKPKEPTKIEGGGDAEGGADGADGDVDDSPVIFGQPLSKAVTIDDGSEIPPLIEQAIRVVELDLKTVGIYRLSGSAVQINEYKAMYDRGEKVDLSKEPDPHCVAGLMKQYFRELPEPLLTWDLYELFLAAADAPKCGCSRELQLKYIKHLFAQLPALSYAVLHLLVGHLLKVSLEHKVNKMAMHNLATVFAPNLLRKRNANMLEMVEDTPQINSLFNTLLKDYDEVFEDKETSDIKDVSGAAVKAMYSYTPTGDGELELVENCLVHIVYVQEQTGWTIGYSNGKFGKFPTSYVNALSDDQRAKSIRRQKIKENQARIGENMESAVKAIASLEAEKQALLAAIDGAKRRRQEMLQKKTDNEQLIASLLGDGGAAEDFKKHIAEFKTNLDQSNKTHESLMYVKQQLIQSVERMNDQLKQAATHKKKSKDKKHGAAIHDIEVIVQKIFPKFISDDLGRKQLAEKRNTIAHEVDALSEVLDAAPSAAEAGEAGGGGGGDGGDGGGDDDGGGGGGGGGGWLSPVVPSGSGGTSSAPAPSASKPPGEAAKSAKSPRGKKPKLKKPAAAPPPPKPA